MDEIPSILPPDDPEALLGAYRRYIPLYTLRAAAGKFGEGQEVEPEGWIETPEGVRATPDHFAARIEGHSMEPDIPDGSLGIFRANPQGTRQGKIVLAQWRGPADPETGGAFTVKVYESGKTYGPDGDWKHEWIKLKPLNPDYPVLDFNLSDGEFLKIAAELVGLVKPPPKDGP